eukprot:31163-Pelagococcus_subviridis.AAC.4
MHAARRAGLRPPAPARAHPPAAARAPKATLSSRVITSIRSRSLRRSKRSRAPRLHDGQNHRHGDDRDDDQRAAHPPPTALLVLPRLHQARVPLVHVLHRLPNLVLDVIQHLPLRLDQH